MEYGGDKAALQAAEGQHPVSAEEQPQRRWAHASLLWQVASDDLRDVPGAVGGVR